MKKKKYLFVIITILFLSSLACNLGITVNTDYTATESALKETQISLENLFEQSTNIPKENGESIAPQNTIPTATITPEWLVPQTSIYLTQIEMPNREDQKPNATVEFKIHYGNWSNVSIPPFDIKCLLIETGEIEIVENIQLEPTKDGITTCALTLPDHSGSYSIQAFLDINHDIENRDDSEISMINNGYIE